MPLYITDYLRDTMHLTHAQHGAYLLLLMCSWSADGVLPDNDERFASICRCSIEYWQNHLKPVLSEFFDVEGGLWTHQRVVKERVKAKHLENVKAHAGSMGGSKTAANRAALIASNAQQTTTPSPSPSPSLKEINKRAFEKPTMEQVRLLGAKSGLPESEADAFFYHYDSKGWKVGKEPMMSLKSAMGGWATRWRKNGGSTQSHLQSGGFD